MDTLREGLLGGFVESILKSRIIVMFLVLLAVERNYPFEALSYREQVTPWTFFFPI